MLYKKKKKYTSQWDLCKVNLPKLLKLIQGSNGIKVQIRNLEIEIGEIKIEYETLDDSSVKYSPSFSVEFLREKGIYPAWVKPDEE